MQHVFQLADTGMNRPRDLNANATGVACPFVLGRSKLDWVLSKREILILRAVYFVQTADKLVKEMSRGLCHVRHASMLHKHIAYSFCKLVEVIHRLDAEDPQD